MVVGNKRTANQFAWHECGLIWNNVTGSTFSRPTPWSASKLQASRSFRPGDLGTKQNTRSADWASELIRTSNPIARRTNPNMPHEPTAYDR